MTVVVRFLSACQSSLEVRVLGPLDVLDGGTALPLGGRKQRALLAVLVLHAGDVVSTDRLIDALWGLHPPSTALQTIRTYVSHLRRLLGPYDDRIETRPPGYRLRLHPDELDAERFAGAVSRARGTTRAVELLNQALAMWRGEPYADFAYESFAQAEIRRLHALRWQAIEDRFDAQLALGMDREIVGELEHAVFAEPHRERIRGQLMVALYRAGRHRDALRMYQAYRSALAEEAGLEPSARLRELEAAILLQSPELDAPNPPPGRFLFPHLSLRSSSRGLQYRPTKRSIATLAAAQARNLVSSPHR